MLRLRRLLSVLLILPVLFLPALAENTEIPEADPEEVIRPQWRVPDYVTWLLEVASSEVGYAEGEHGRTKYGEWAGDPYCQWCAEFQCWCVDQVDRRYGTSLLKNVYPLYSGSNEGRAWFITAGRYVVRKGEIEEWGYEWLKGASSFIRSGDYIPQPGDWMFFTWTSDEDTDHVAMVEYCTRNRETGAVTVHVIEGNNPSAVARNTYDIHNSRILGYGTVHDAADVMMHFGNRGEKVRQLQEKLVYLGYLSPEGVDGIYGNSTVDALKAFQADAGLRPGGYANMVTQQHLDEAYDRKYYNDPSTWFVDDE